MEEECLPLIEILSEIPDFRKTKCKCHPLAILALACVATMCGYKGYRAFSEWGSDYGGEFMKALGFTHVIGLVLPPSPSFSAESMWNFWRRR
jgi:hypothetical protein